MVRKNLIGVEDRTKFRCPVPVCSKQKSNKRALAQHIAMSRNSLHRAWRVEHSLPVDYETMADVGKMMQKIKEMI